jgi:uncharacterized protein YbjT (DUF2867 family)
MTGGPVLVTGATGRIGRRVVDELVAAQVPSLGAVAWTLAYYRRYADALRERAKELGHGWTPVMVERALWSHAGGKAGARRKGTTTA